MQGSNNTGNNRPQIWKKNTFETLKDFGSSMVKKSTSDITNTFGTGLMDSFLSGKVDNTQNKETPYSKQPEAPMRAPSIRPEFNIFNRTRHVERDEVPKQIQMLHEQIRRELIQLKRANESLLAEVRDIDKLSVESLGDKPGVYHIRFLEIVISILKTLRQKVGESRTWLAAMTSRKQKRGSAFAANTKKKGTQYSMSQELSTARSVQ